MTTKETARLEARVPMALYASLKQAAQLKGGTITNFVVNALHDAAHRAIEDANIFRLSAEDQVRFAQALIDPPKPNAALRRAAKRHGENVEVRRAGFIPKPRANTTGRSSRAATRRSTDISAPPYLKT